MVALAPTVSVPLVRTIVVPLVVAFQLAPEAAPSINVRSVPLAFRSISCATREPIPEKLVVPKSIVIASPAARPVGVTKVRVWLDTTAGAESESVLLKEVTFAASARNEGTPTNHKMIAKVTTAVRAWSNVNVEFVLNIYSTLY